MKEVKITSSYRVAKDITDLNKLDRALLLEAKEAAKHAYAPYSKFYVGAALRFSDGQIIQGNNQENAAYPVTMCAERIAFFTASANYPNKIIESVAITVSTTDMKINSPVPPCGSCRQVIYEKEYRQERPIKIILQGDKGDIYLIDSVKDILPLLFDASYLI